MDIADQASDREMADREFALAARRAARPAGRSHRTAWIAASRFRKHASKPYPASRSAWNARPFKNIKGEPTHDRTS